MIENLLGETCSILHLTKDSRDSFGQFDYWEEKDVSCLAVSVMESVKRNSESINLVRDFDLYISGNLITQIASKDKIVYNGYEYEIVPRGIWFGKDLITGSDEFVVLAVEKRKEYPSTTVEIKRR